MADGPPTPTDIEVTAEKPDADQPAQESDVIEKPESVKQDTKVPKTFRRNRRGDYSEGGVLLGVFVAANRLDDANRRLFLVLPVMGAGDAKTGHLQVLPGDLPNETRFA